MNENTVVMETVNPVQQVIYIINFCLSCKKFICQFFKTDKIFAPDTEFMTEFILRFFCGKTACKVVNMFKLIQFCTKALDHAEQKVKILQKGEDGALAETDFTKTEGTAQ